MVDRRPATESDIPFLLTLRRECQADGSAAAAKPLSDAEHLQRLRYRFECVEVLLHEARPVGMFKLLKGANTWELLQFQVTTTMQGRGIGRALLEAVIAEAQAAGVTLATCVLKDNPARHLYESLGFRISGEDAREFHMRLRQPAC